MGLPIPHEEQQASADNPKWVMKELKPWHRQLCSLLAQGLDRQTIASILDCTPEYVSMLGRQSLIQEYVKEMSGFAQLQLEAQFTKAVTAIGEVLENGGHKEKMQAARLQMEATKRIGSRAVDEQKIIDSNNRLASLAERLLALQDRARTQPDTIHAEVIKDEKEDAEEGQWSDQSAQADGDGSSY